MKAYIIGFLVSTIMIFVGMGIAYSNGKFAAPETLPVQPPATISRVGSFTSFGRGVEVYSIGSVVVFVTENGEITCASE